MQQATQQPVVMNFSFALKKRKKSSAQQPLHQHDGQQQQQQQQQSVPDMHKKNQQQCNDKHADSGQLGKIPRKRREPTPQSTNEGNPHKHTRMAKLGLDMDLPPSKKQKSPVVNEVAGDGLPGTNGAGSRAKAKRFILFVGNMPFNSSEDDIRQHFLHCNVVGCRLLRNKDTAVGKGIAFVDFLDSKGYLAALKLHHSLFGGRRINVEPTAGGGGNSSQRLGKIELKKKRLEKAFKGDAYNNRGGEKIAKQAVQPDLPPAIAKT